MAKGIKVNNKNTLVVYSTKVEPGTKDLMTALVSVGAFEGQRELIEKMLSGLQQTNPQLFEKAQQLLALQGKGWA